MKRWRTIGIIGGMGPAATADFLARLVAAVPAAGDADHPRILLDSNPAIPDRNAARAGTGPSPAPALAKMALGLVAAGAEILAMPCNAAHGWSAAIETATDAIFIDMIDAAVEEAAATGAKVVGVMAIGATLDARLYHDRLAVRDIKAIDADRIEVEFQVALIKSGQAGPAVRLSLIREAARMVDLGAEAIVAACSEVPLVLAASDVSVPFIDATAALVRRTLRLAAL